MGLSLCFSAVVPVWLSPQCGCWRIRYKTKEVVWTKVFADMVGKFAQFLKVSVQSLHIVSSDFNTSFQTVHTFTSITCVHVRTIALAMHLCTQNIATPTIIPYPHERGPTTECRPPPPPPPPHFGLNFLLRSSVYSNMHLCVAALENGRLKWLVYED